MAKEFALEYLDGVKKVIEGIPLGSFKKILDILANAREKETSIFIMGNGGSAATASHFACDMNKGASVGLKKRFKVTCLNDNIPTMLAYGNDYSYEDIFVEQLKNFLKPRDIVIGISASGNSKNVIKAIRLADREGAVTIGLTGFNGGMLAKIAKVSLVVPSDDMQKIEDLHLVLVHIIMQFFKKL